MCAFSSQNAYHQFAQSIRDGARWVLPDSAIAFLKEAREGARARIITLKTESSLFRAQLGTSVEDANGLVGWEHPLPAHKMIPDAQFIKEGGRANPAGVAYLYLASDEKTALAEMRPWVNESTTLATFQPTKALKIVRCDRRRSFSLSRYLYSDHSSAQIQKYVWQDIGEAFSRPVTREERESLYVPTQILAQAFQAEGFDGIAYHSGLERGINVVLFDPTNARLVHRFAYSLKRVRYDFEAIPNHAICRGKDSESLIIDKIKTDSQNLKRRRKAKALKEG